MNSGEVIVNLLLFCKSDFSCDMDATVGGFVWSTALAAEDCKYES